MIRFEWDQAKNRINREKHLVGFETAMLVFDDPTVWFSWSASNVGKSGGTPLGWSEAGAAPSVPWFWL
jgi:uncharacterized DUF497 family protein